MEPNAPASSPAAIPGQTPAAPDAPTRRTRLIAFYLPQYHPIPENDAWWGPGFTEWTKVTQARPLFPGHQQPHLPADLGFYDLRLPEARAAQARLAREAGIEGFCYWHYWFAGKRLLERPFAEMLRLREPDFPFCLGWANQSWTGIWHGAPRKILIEQTYPGRDDYERHFHALLEAFHDPRYIRIHDRPVFLVYRPTELPDAPALISQWQELARRNGLAGIHFVAHALFNEPFDHRAAGFAAAVYADTFRIGRFGSWRRAQRLHGASPEPRTGWDPRVWATAAALKWRKQYFRPPARPAVYDYGEASRYFLDSVSREPDAYPCVIPNWDNSPRSSTRAIVLRGSTPELFREHLRQALRVVAHRPDEERVVFVKSWNEWAEGNYLEPDVQYGRAYLEVVADEILAAPR